MAITRDSRGEAQRTPALLTTITIALMLIGPCLTSDGLAGQDAERRATSRPNILLIGIDTLRGDYLHSAGMTWLQTPHLDALVADGIYFENCHASSPWTLPSFASVFTGLLPYRHGAIGGDYQILPENIATLAELLAEDGYRTGACVAIHWLTEKYGMDQGFQSFKYDNAAKLTGERAEGVLQWGREFVAAEGDAPFFLMLHFYDIHSPYVQPEPFDRMYYDCDEKAEGTPIVRFLRSEANHADNRKSGLYRWLQGVTDMNYPLRQYPAGVTAVDAYIGGFLDHLRRIGLYDDLLIVLVSDHGEHLGEHDLYFTHTYPYHETMHVPLIVKLPRGEHAGRAVNAPVSIVDVMPTILDRAGVPVPGALDGRSLTGRFAGDDAGPRDAEPVIAEWGATVERYAKALVQWPWKLMLFKTGEEYDYRLYDLSADPSELDDLSEMLPGVADRLRRQLWRIFDREQPTLVVDQERPVELSPEEKARLRSLGYID